MGARVRLRSDLRSPQYEINVTWQGQRVRRLAGANRRRAEQEAADILRALKAGQPVSEHTGASTLDTYATPWLAALTNRTREDDRRLYRRHIGPRLGTRRLDQLDQLDVRAWIAAMAAEPLEATGRPPKARTVRNAHSVLSRMLSDAVADRLIAVNPASAERIGKKALPRAGRNRQSPGPRDHALQLMEDERIPLDRRVLYALQYLTGMRIGEAVARRWRDIDTEAPGLWALHVVDQYDGQPLKTESDDDGEDIRARAVPVHPALRAVLETWRRDGWAARYGRSPEPDDLITPDPRDRTRPRTKNQAIKARYRDLRALGRYDEAAERSWRGTHTGRRWLVTYAREDGAQPDVLERVTHNAVGEMIDRYTWTSWPSLCRSVLALQAETPAWACHGFCHVRESGGEMSKEVNSLPVEAPGVEPVGQTRKPRSLAGLRGAALDRFVASIRRNPRALVQIATHVADAAGLSHREDVVAAVELLASALGRPTHQQAAGGGR